MGPEHYAVASFVGPGCRGNQHWVCVNPIFSSEKEKHTWLNRTGDNIAVFLDTGSSSRPRAEFYQFGRPILRCGSGTLAAAHVLDRELRRSDLRWLETGAGKLALRAEGDYLGYGARGLAMGENKDSRLWQSLVSQTIDSAWYIGGQHDYCLLEVETEQALRDLMVDTEALGQSCDRALIVTARASTPAYDYALRYFAPQHGKPEDPATGSANLQVAAFWRERLNKTCLHGRQLSTAGGDFKLEVEGDLVWVMGKTEKLTEHDQ